MYVYARLVYLLSFLKLLICDEFLLNFQCIVIILNKYKNKHQWKIKFTFWNAKSFYKNYNQY